MEDITEKDLLDFDCDEDLMQLEKLYSKFNIFDCLKLARTEIRHSNFLSWLMDPNETHELKDDFLKEFLLKVLENNKNQIEEINNKEISVKKYPQSQNEKTEKITQKYFIPTAQETKSFDLSNIDIYRELEDIDLLIVDETNKLVIVIENKIDSCQHSEQLAKYRTYIDNEYSNTEYKKLFIYLKPDRKNEEVELPYIFVDYNLIKNIIVNIVNDKISDDEIKIVLTHYKELIEREIMAKDNIGNECIKIYRKHKKVIDEINKYINPRPEDLFEALKEVLQEEKDLIISNIEDNGIICLPTGITNTEMLKFSTWEPDKFVVHLHFMNCKNGHKDVCFELLLGPVEKEYQPQKEKLIEYLKKSLNIKFKGEKEDWCCPRAETLISMEEYYNCDTKEAIKSIIKDRLETYKQKYIENLKKALNSWKY